MADTDHTKTLAYLGAALAVFIGVWNLGAYAHGVLGKAQALSGRVSNLEKAVYGIQHVCECARDVEPRITLADPVDFPSGSIIARGSTPDTEVMARESLQVEGTVVRQTFPGDDLMCLDVPYGPVDNLGFPLDVDEGHY